MLIPLLPLAKRLDLEGTVRRHLPEIAVAIRRALNQP
jgi:hypothetical protein